MLDRQDAAGTPFRRVVQPWQRWTRRAEILIAPGSESNEFSGARIFAAAYPEAVASPVSSPRPPGAASPTGTPLSSSTFIATIGQRLGGPVTRPPTPKTRSRTGWSCRFSRLTRPP